MSRRTRTIASIAMLTLAAGLISSPASASTKGPAPVTKVTTSQSPFKVRTVRDANTGTTSARVKASAFCVKAKSNADWYGEVLFITYTGKSVNPKRFLGAGSVPASYGETAEACFYVGKTSAD